MERYRCIAQTLTLLWTFNSCTSYRKVKLVNRDLHLDSESGIQCIMQPKTHLVDSKALILILSSHSAPLNSKWHQIYVANRYPFVRQCSSP